MLGTIEGASMFREQIQQNDVGNTAKIFLGRLFLLLNTLTWLFMVRAISVRLVELEKAAIVNTFYLGVIVSVLIGAILSDKIRRFHLVFVWIVFGMFASFLPLFWTSNLMILQMIINFAIGFSFGLGLPSCVACFAESTTFQNRGRMGGLIFLLSTLCALPLLVLLQNDLLIVSMASFFWRISGFCALPVVESIETEEKKPTSFLLVLQTKSFFLYFVPLLMFCFVDGFETAFFESFFSAEFSLNRVIEPVFGAIFALVGGLLADRIGRKKVIIYGFVSLGIAYAVIGLAPYWIVSWYFYSVIDGIAWGIFYVMFALVLWGDMAHSNHRKEKYYAIGGIPFFLSEFIVTLFVLRFEIIPKESALTSFSIAAFFLFLAVIPLMYASETLPEKKIKEMELRSYIEKAKKIKEKRKG
jgi:MFS family permease